MMPVLQLGPLALPLPALLYLLSIWLGLSLAEKLAADHGLKPDDIFNIGMVALISGVIGARLATVARYPAAFAGHPLDIFSRNPGMLDPMGGLVAGALVTAIYIQRKGLSFWKVLDGLSPALAVFLAGGHLASQAAGTGPGKPSSLPWAIELLGEQRHPVHVYEFLAAALILAWVWQASRSVKERHPGVVFLTFLACSAASRLFFDAFRIPAGVLPGGLITSQVLAWIILAMGLLGVQLRMSHPKSVERATTEEP